MSNAVEKSIIIILTCNLLLSDWARSCNLYADDTLIYCRPTGSNIVELKTNIQKCVTDVHERYESNKLVVNTSKSNVMLLTTRLMLSHMTYTDLNVYIGNHELLQCNNIKYH